MALKKSDLYSSLWASCDQLRGGMDASQYKDYVLFMLFIKYVTDKYGNSDDYAPPVTIPKGASFKDMIALKGKSDIGDKINTKVIQPLIDANTRLARSDFPDFNDPNKLGEGQAMVERLTNLIAIFENPALDFSQNRAEHDDILGDAYEYLMRHFATESGKSKGQFYTPAEVSRVIAKVIGISPSNTKASTTAYDPTCGSGSLLLKVAAESAKHITLEGQEKDVTTAGLARMNMILHDFPTANILSGDTIAAPKFKEGQTLRTYDYVVANPPFSDKSWSTGITPSTDPYQRFAWGEPPARQGDYAYLLHIIRSMKSSGKAACILPHGVLFRGNAEALIRRKLVESGYLKGIIGLPANLFYGTGIPACIVVLDKENAPTRRGIFMIDASEAFIKDGNKNRLREQDIHRIVDTFRKQTDVPRYARMVPFDEIADPKNDFNLNLARYIHSTAPEDIQDIDAHLRGGIPERDLDALAVHWEVLPTVRAALFESAGRAGYAKLRVPVAQVKSTILGHEEFAAFNTNATRLFAAWRNTSKPKLSAFGKDGHPKALIEDLSEDLLATFRKAPLLDPYDVYQRLMDYWNQTMQDDAYLISADGWIKGAQPREIKQIKNKDNKLVWPEEHDYLKGKRRLKSDLVPATLLISKFFTKEREAITALDDELRAIEQQLAEMIEEHSGEDGLFSEVLEGDGDRLRITAKALNARLRDIEDDPTATDEQTALKAFAGLLERQSKAKSQRKTAQQHLDAELDAKYPTLTETEIKALVIDDKWITHLTATVLRELERVSLRLAGRILELAERYAVPLPQLGVHQTAFSSLAHLVEAQVPSADLKRAVVQQLLSGRMRLPGFSEEWRRVKLGDHATFLSHGTYARADLASEGSVRYLHYGDVHSASSPWLDVSSTPMPYLPNELARRLDRLTTGDLVLVDASEDLVGIGKSVEICGADCMDIVAGLHTIAVRFDKSVLADGFKGLLQFMPSFKSQLEKLAAGTKVYASNKTHVARVEMELPEPPEQLAIAAVITAMDEEIAALERRTAKMRLLKQGIMQELLTGGTRLVSPSLSPNGAVVHA